MDRSLDLSKVRVAGSAEEIQELGIKPKTVYVCGPERPGFRQCPLHEECELAQKNETGFVRWMKDAQEVKPKGPTFADLEGAERHGPGPMNIGVRRTKIIGGNNFRMVNTTMRCWEYPHQKRKQLKHNEPGEEPVALIQIIAIEGQTINLPGSKPVVQDDLKIIHVIQPEGIPTVIAPFQRPRESPAFAASAAAVAEINREEMLRRKTTLKDFVKLTPTVPDDEPFDLTESSPAANPGAAKGGASSRG